MSWGDDDPISDPALATLPSWGKDDEVVSSDKLTAQAEPKLIAPEPAKHYTYKIFGGKFPQPKFALSDEEGQYPGMIAPDYTATVPRLPQSQKDLKDGQWYNITDPRDGTLVPHVWSAEKQAFYDLPTAQTNPDYPARQRPKSKYEIAPPNPGALTWSNALGREWAAGNDEAGSQDAALTAHVEHGAYPDLTVPKGFKPVEPATQGDAISQRLAIEGGPADAARRYLEETYPDFKDNALIRSLVTGLTQAGSSMLGAFEKVAGSRELGNALNRQVATTGQAAQYEAQTNPSMLSPEVQQQVTGGIEFGAKLAASGGSFPVYTAQSAVEAATQAHTQATDAGLKGTAKDAYVVGHAASDLLTNLLFAKFGAPQAELAKGVGSTLAESLVHLLPAVGAGTAAQMVGEVASKAHDQLTGIDPTALTPDRLKESLTDALKTQFAFGIVSHIAKPALEGLAKSSTWKAVKDATGARIGNADARQQLSDAAKAVVEQNAPQGQPEAVTPEQSVPQPTEVPNATQQVDVVRTDNQGVARQRQAVPADQTQVRGQTRAEAGGGDRLQGQGGEPFVAAGVKPSDFAIGKVVEHLKGQGIDVKPVEPQTDTDKEIHSFLQERGVHPVWIDSQKGANGFNVAGVTMVKAGLEPNQAWGTAIHELAHRTEFDQGNAYDEKLIQEAAQRYLYGAEKNLPDYAEKLKQDPGLLRREGVAKLAQEIWENPHAREMLEAKSPGLLQRIKDFILKLIGAHSPEDKAVRATLEWLRKTAAPEPTGEPVGQFSPLQETTAAKNASMEEDRRILELADLPPAERQSWEQARAEAVAQKIPENALAIAIEAHGSGRSLTTQESAGLNERINAIKNEHDFLSERIGKLTDPADAKQAAADLQRLESEFDTIHSALKKAGTKAGQQLAIRKLTIDRDFNLLSVKARATAAKGERLTPKEELELTGATQRLKQTVDRQEELTNKLEGRKQRQKQLDLEATQAEAAKLQEKIDKAPMPVELRKLAQQLARHFVEQGVSDRTELTDKVHAVISSALPDVSRRQTMDAISGYGDFKQLSKDEVSVRLRDLKGQLQQIAKLEDMAKGQAPSKTGIERRAPTDEERRLIQQVNEAKKKGGFVVTDPEKQLKSALDAIKTRLKNQISDLQSQIDSRQKIVKERTAVPRDEEALRLESERDKLKEQFDQIFGKPKMSDEQRIAIAKRALESSIAEYENRLKNGDFSPMRPPSQTPNTPELEAMRQHRDILKKMYAEDNPNPPELQRAKKRLAQLQEHFAKGTLPETAEPRQQNPKTAAIRQQIAETRKLLNNSEPAQKARLQKTIDRLQKRLAENDFPQKSRAEKVISKQVESLQLKANLLRRDIQNKIRALKPRTPLEKIFNMEIYWRRLGVLTSPISILKLGSAAVEGMTVNLMQEAIGAGILKAFPGLAARVRAESSSSIRIEANALAKAFTMLGKDAYNNIVHGTTDYEAKYGDRLPTEMRNFAGNIHAGTKSSLKRQTFERAFSKIAQVEATNGANLDDPMVQMKIGTQAYAEANRALFLEDNKVVDLMQGAEQAVMRPSKETGKPAVSGQVLRLAMKNLFPIVRIPTNLASRTFQATFGSLVGGARLAHAYARGIDSLPPEQADSIMRQLKAGSLGAAFFLLGYYNRKNVGGYYQPGEKRDEQDVKASGLRVFGVDLPAWTQHNPFLMVMQLGATVGRVADSYARKSDTEPRGMASGLLRGGLSVAEEAPIVRETFDLGKAHENPEKFLKDYGESIVVPLGAKWLYQKVVPKDTSAEDAKQLKQINNDIKELDKNRQSPRGLEIHRRAVERLLKR